MSTDTDSLIRGLRAWTRGHDAHVRAATELLISYSGAMWLRRSDFPERYITARGHQATVDFARLASDLQAGTAPGASTTEVGALRLAADIGTDRWYMSRMGQENAMRAVLAFNQGSGVVSEHFRTQERGA